MISRSSAPASAARTPSRKRGWSSTSRIRVIAPPWAGRRAAGCRSGAGDDEPAADLLGALPHRLQAQPVGAGCSGRPEPSSSTRSDIQLRGRRAGRHPAWRPRASRRWPVPRPRSGSTRPRPRPGAARPVDVAPGPRCAGVDIRSPTAQARGETQVVEPAGRRSSVMARRSSTAVATPAAADRSRPPAAGSATGPAPTPPGGVGRPARRRRRRGGRAAGGAAPPRVRSRARPGCAAAARRSRRAAIAGATWSQTRPAARRHGCPAPAPRAGVTRSVPTTSPRWRMGSRRRAGRRTARRDGADLPAIDENKRRRAEPQRLDDHRADPDGHLGEVHALTQPEAVAYSTRAGSARSP